MALSVPEEEPLLRDQIVPEDWIIPGAPPLEIDVGCHKGLFLIEMARLFPGHNFLGIERQAERVERTGRKISRLQLTNASVARADGLESLQILPDACADWIHVLFPDPWPKRRHHVRRLINESFLHTCARVLKPHGCLRVMTDDADYAFAIRSALTACEEQFVETAGDDRPYPETEFQKKFLPSGKSLHSFLRTRRKKAD